MKLPLISNSTEIKSNLVGVPSLNIYICLESTVRVLIRQTQLCDSRNFCKCHSSIDLACNVYNSLCLCYCRRLRLMVAVDFLQLPQLCASAQSFCSTSAQETFVGSFCMNWIGLIHLFTAQSNKAKFGDKLINTRSC